MGFAVRPFAFALIGLLVTSPLRWTPPVDVSVVDWFRPPASPFAPGNRGLEYATVGGEEVRAVAEGQVTFVGRIGRSRFLVVDHDDGLRSTYAYIQEALVVRGQRVTGGQQIAIAGPGFHLTARSGEAYLDPAQLFEGARRVPHLIPAEEMVGTRRPFRGARRPLGVPSLPQPGADQLIERVPAAAQAMATEVGALRLGDQLEAIADAASAWRQQECTPDGVAVAPIAEARTLIQVGGLGSRSDDASIGRLDAAALGYSSDDVIGFSYAGGCTPQAFGPRPLIGLGAEPDPPIGALTRALVSRAYLPVDTFQDIDVSAARLAELIVAAATARPGQPIDVAAHSLGGVVARRAVELLARQGRLDRATLPLEVVLTIGSPHQGTDLATLGQAIEGTPVASVIDRVTAYRDTEAVRQLSESTVTEPLVPPAGITAVAVAGATDVVVPGDHAIWPGAENVVVPPSWGDRLVEHAELPARPEVARALALAVAGRDPACLELADLVRSTVLSRGISTVEDVAGVVVGIGRYLG